MGVLPKVLTAPRDEASSFHISHQIVVMEGSEVSISSCPGMDDTPRGGGYQSQYSVCIIVVVITKSKKSQKVACGLVVE